MLLPLQERQAARRPALSFLGCRRSRSLAAVSVRCHFDIEVAFSGCKQFGDFLSPLAQFGIAHVKIDVVTRTIDFVTVLLLD